MGACVIKKTNLNCVAELQSQQNKQLPSNTAVKQIKTNVRAERGSSR